MKSALIEKYFMQAVKALASRQPFLIFVGIFLFFRFLFTLTLFVGDESYKILTMDNKEKTSSDRVLPIVCSVTLFLYSYLSTHFWWGYTWPTFGHNYETDFWLALTIALYFSTGLTILQRHYIMVDEPIKHKKEPAHFYAKDPFYDFWNSERYKKANQLFLKPLTILAFGIFLTAICRPLGLPMIISPLAYWGSFAFTYISGADNYTITNNKPNSAQPSSYANVEN